MTKLPRLTARQIISVLQKAGFSVARQSGSHMIYNNAAGKRVTVPLHATKILHPKVLRSGTRGRLPINILEPTSLGGTVLFATGGARLQACITTALFGLGFSR